MNAHFGECFGYSARWRYLLCRCEVGARQLKYTIDNDATRFAWADSEGKGIIYRMIDEHDNDCPYDFKNLQFYNNGNWYYTFSQDGRDLSLTDYCVGNYILPHTNQNFSDGTTAVKLLFQWWCSI